MADFTMHGPMWQYECNDCGYMGDCWDSESEAAGELERHSCLDTLPPWARYEIERLRSATPSTEEGQR